MRAKIAVDTRVNGIVWGFKPSLDAIASPNWFSGISSTIIVLTGNAIPKPFKNIGKFTVPMATTGNTILRATLIISEIHIFNVRLNLLNILLKKITFQSTYTQCTEDLYIVIGYINYNLTNT